MPHSRRDERGQMVAVEAAVILPALLLIAGLVILLGRDALAEQAVGSAAASAARAASIERNANQASGAAQAAAGLALGEAGINCSSQSVVVDAGALNSPTGVPAAVSVTVTCVVIHEVSLPGFPATTTVTAARTSPVDTYRSN